MAKKRPHEGIEANPVEIPTQISDTETLPEQSPSKEPVHPLMSEIQSFMNLRDELARKLAAEIEAMEQKLAELKETAASLFPRSNESPVDRKTKKPKAKASKSESSGSANATDSNLGE
jgi:hypothetical protein